ncbi:MAG TPA: VTT domain-containing protein [Myxococcales bacterium]
MAEPSRRAALARGIALAVVLAIAAAAAAFLPVRDWLAGAVAWTRGAGPLGVAAYFAVAVVAATLLVPKVLLVFGAGFAFGAGGGLAVGLSASVTAATLSFAIGRTVGRSWIQGRIAGDARWGAVDEAVGRDGFGIVLLMRLSPLFPYGLVNYALGLSRVRTRDFVVASLLGMVPLNLLYAWMGSLAPTVAEALAGRGDWGPWDWATGAAGLLASLGVLVLLMRAARRGLGVALSTKEEVGGNGEA